MTAEIVAFPRAQRELEALARFNESCDLAAKLVWPEIPPRDWADQISRQGLATFAAESPEAAKAVVGLLKRGEDHATQLLRLLRTAAVRETCGIVLSGIEAGSNDDPCETVQS